MRAQPAAADAEKFINEGKVHFFRGHKAQAQIAFARALDVNPDDKEARALFVDAVASQGFQNFNPLMKQAIAICLDDPDLMQLWLFFPWYTTLMLDPEMQTLASLQGFEDYEALAAELSEFDYSESLNDEFFLAGLCKLLVKDYKFERLLTGLRRYALMHEDEREAILPFLTALAAQCFFNEYIFYVASEEQVVIDELRARQDALSAEEIVMLGCYVPLYALRNADKLAAALRESAEMLVKLQITEPLREKEIRAQMESFGSIKNSVSQAVQEQYEEHPYPRWISCGGIIRDEEKRSQSVGRKILIAGCGTGQQSSVAAMQFPKAEMIGIDLSRASLAYATRKGQEYGLGNITYKHGDILEVGALGQVFDYIACGGVLHHMASPRDGLKALKAVLAPDGAMRIALYSEIARRNIVAVQKWVVEKNIPSTLEGMRNFRKFFVEEGHKEIFKDHLPFFDNFSTSECRDLFFHVQEHRFTCLGLKELLEELDLELLSFAPEAQVARKKYLAMFVDDPLALNLENWHKFESAHLDIFIGMYKFYIGHKGAHEKGVIPGWIR